MNKPISIALCFMALCTTCFSQNDSSAISKALNHKNRKANSAKADVYIVNKTIISAQPEVKKTEAAILKKIKKKKGSGK